MFEFDTDKVKMLADKHPSFALSARFWTGNALFNIGETAYLLELQDGKLADFRKADRTAPADITISGPEPSWIKLMQRPAPPASKVSLQLLEHVGQRWGRADAGSDGEAKAVGLADVVVGVLAEQEDLDLVVGGVFEGVEDVGLGREDLVPEPFLGEEGLELKEIRPGELTGQRGSPGLGQWVGAHR
jgi:hypothetical protein